MDSIPETASNQTQNGDNTNVRMTANGKASNAQRMYGATCLMNLAFMLMSGAVQERGHRPQVSLS